MRRCINSCGAHIRFNWLDINAKHWLIYINKTFGARPNCSHFQNFFFRLKKVKRQRRPSRGEVSSSPFYETVVPPDSRGLATAVNVWTWLKRNPPHHSEDASEADREHNKPNKLLLKMIPNIYAIWWSCNWSRRSLQVKITWERFEEMVEHSARLRVGGGGALRCDNQTFTVSSGFTKKKRWKHGGTYF